MRVLIAGCGWLGRALGTSLLADGLAAVGIRRDAAACRALASLGIEPLRLDLNSTGAAGSLPADVDAIVACQAADGRDAAAYRRTYVDATRPLLEHAARHGARLVWVGSTGVFGQTDGSEVTETTPPVPTSPTGEVLVEAERQVLTAAATGTNACLVRLSGLYGPERYGVIERVRSGILGLGSGDDAWMNWCHREDAVRAVRALLDRGRPGATYHASDAEPARRREVVRFICDRLGIEPKQAGPSQRRTHRRIGADATRKELGIDLAYPSYREGLEPGFE